MIDRCICGMWQPSAMGRRMCARTCGSAPGRRGDGRRRRDWDYPAGTRVEDSTQEKDPHPNPRLEYRAKGKEEYRAATGDSSPSVTIAIAKKKGTNAVWVARNVLEKVTELQRTVVPTDMQLVVTRNMGVTANHKVNELLEALWRGDRDRGGTAHGRAGLARSAHCRGGDPDRLCPDARGESAVWLHDQPRDTVCPDPGAGACWWTTRSSTWRTSTATSTFDRKKATRQDCAGGGQ